MFTSMCALGHILVSQAQRVDHRCRELSQPLKETLSSYIVVLSIHRVPQAKHSEVEASQHGFLHSKVSYCV